MHTDDDLIIEIGLYFVYNQQCDQYIIVIMIGSVFKLMIDLCKKCWNSV